MKLKFVLGSASLIAASLLLVSAVHADTLDVRKNAQMSRAAGLPTRGLSMAQVEQRYGAPVKNFRPRAAMRRSIRRSTAGATTATPCISSAIA